MKPAIDKNKFGPWAVVTGASSGIGKEFACQLAACGLFLVLVARRGQLLEEIGQKLSGMYGIEYITIEADLSESSAIDKIIKATDHLQIGLLISNAGTGKPGNFFAFKETELAYIVQLNALSHLSLTHH